VLCHDIGDVMSTSDRFMLLMLLLVFLLIAVGFVLAFT
jgi:predicted nucleic acid-binding Zn ribbon protein